MIRCFDQEAKTHYKRSLLYKSTKALKTKMKLMRQKTDRFYKSYKALNNKAIAV